MKLLADNQITGPHRHSNLTLFWKKHLNLLHFSVIMNILFPIIKTYSSFPGIIHSSTVHSTSVKRTNAPSFAIPLFAPLVAGQNLQVVCVYSQAFKLVKVCAAPTRKGYEHIDNIQPC